MDTHEKYMKEAIRQARKAYALWEVPIGCVIVYEGKIIARGYNRRNTDKNTTSHAEMNAIRKASRKLGDWRLEGCTLYVTLEPCAMCAGLIAHARLSRVVFGARDEKTGAYGGSFDLQAAARLNHRVQVDSGVCGKEAAQLLTDFFEEKRRA